MTKESKKSNPIKPISPPLCRRAISLWGITGRLNLKGAMKKRVKKEFEKISHLISSWKSFRGLQESKNKIPMKHFLKIAIMLTFFMAPWSGTCLPADIELIRERMLDNLLQTEVNDAEIGELIETLKPDGTWPGINYEDVSREGFEHRIHHGNMVQLSRAYRAKSSEYYQSEEVIKTIESALKHWVEKDYICDNWWHNQIGTPNNMVNLMLLVGDELPGALVEKAQPIIGRATIDAPGARPGGDRIKIASIHAKNLLFNEEYEKFGEVVDVIEGEIKYVEWIGMKYGYDYRLVRGGFSNRSAGGRGIQYDNSFHHRTDGVNNTLSYGLGYANAFVEWAVYTTGTKYAFSHGKMSQLIDYYLDGICKTAVYGKYPDPGAKNRSISRKGTLRPYGATTPEKLLMTSNYRQKEIQEIIDIRDKGIKPTTSHATFFWHSEHFSFQRPGWFTSVRIYSTRNHNMEVPYNSEGLFNHHRGDGVNHISITGDEYFDIWPVYDYQKIPGTTVMQKHQMPEPREIQKLGETDFAGAVTDGLYGAAAFDFKSPHDPLIGRKAWFFFDEEYVCLGTGISCKNSEFPVVTTLDQCHLRSEVTVSANNELSVLPKGERELENVDWVHQDKVGYVFPEPVNVHLMNDEATGSWWRINKQTDSPKEEVKLDVFKLWVNHGQRPSDESYEYIVVPATSIENLESGASRKNVSIISNTPAVQAVKHQGLQMVQAVFYQAGEIELSGNLKLGSKTPGIVMIKMEGDQIAQVSVADPNRELGEMALRVSAKMEKSGDNYHSFWNESENASELTIELPRGNYTGSSVTIHW